MPIFEFDVPSVNIFPKKDSFDWNSTGNLMHAFYNDNIINDFIEHIVYLSSKNLCSGPFIAVPNSKNLNYFIEDRLIDRILPGSCLNTHFARIIAETQNDHKSYRFMPLNDYNIDKYMKKEFDIDSLNAFTSVEDFSNLLLDNFHLELHNFGLKRKSFRKLQLFITV